MGSKPKFLSMKRHLVMTVFRIKITGLQGNLTAYAWLLALYLHWLYLHLLGMKSCKTHKDVIKHVSLKSRQLLILKAEHTYKLNRTGMEVWNKGCSVTPPPPRGLSRLRLSSTNEHCNSTGRFGGATGSKWKRKQEWSWLQNDCFTGLGLKSSA